MADHRMIDAAGNRVDFTCTNRGYETNIGKTTSHGHGTLAPTTGGSVFPTELLNVQGYTLWVEHVVERATGDECYWLMWYDERGIPKIPASSIFSRDDLGELARRLATLVP